MGKSFALFLVLIALAAPCSTFVTLANAAIPVTDQWTARAAMPTGRRELGVATVNGKIYAIGGIGKNGLLNVNEAYDPVANTWTTRTWMPTARSWFAIAVCENKIYCIGGNSPTSCTGINGAYDPATNTWTTLKSMPTPRRSLTASVVEGKIYLIGGSVPVPGTTMWVQASGLNEVYDPAADRWRAMTPMPTPVAECASAVLDNKIYVFGDSLVQIYDPVTDRWSYGASIPQPTVGAAAGATTGVWAPKRIYVIWGGYLNLNQIFDPEKNVWSTGKPMLTARGYFGIAVVDDVLYAIGGDHKDDFFSNANERYTPVGYGTVPPAVLVVSPENDRTYASSSVPLAFTVNKPATSMSYSLDGRENVTAAGNTTLTGLAGGEHRLTVYAWDTLGSTGASETITFTVAAAVAQPFPTALVAAAAVAIAAAVTTISLIVYFKKQKQKPNHSPNYT